MAETLPCPHSWEDSNGRLVGSVDRADVRVTYLLTLHCSQCGLMGWQVAAQHRQRVPEGR